MLSYFATVSIAASLVQQTHDIVRYTSVVKEQFENRKLHPGNPEIAIANGSVGISLALYYIRQFALFPPTPKQEMQPIDADEDCVLQNTTVIMLRPCASCSGKSVAHAINPEMCCPPVLC